MFIKKLKAVPDLSLLDNAHPSSTVPITESIEGSPDGVAQSLHFSATTLKPSIISEGFEFIGEIKSSGYITVDGIVRGGITGGSVKIGKNGLIDANVKCSDINIRGQFLGKLDCKDLTIVAGAVADGDLSFQSVTIQRGGIIKGELKKKS